MRGVALRMPLPVGVLCVVTGIVGWDATKEPVRAGANAGYGIVAVATELTAAPNPTNAGSTITVTLSPVRAGVTVTQPLQLTASVENDSTNSGVRWSSSGGTLSNQTARSATFTATAAGSYTITATSKADATSSAVASLGVTDLAGVAIWRNDLAHSGVNSKEYALTGQNVASGKFGKLFSCPVDGWVFAQPLWIANVEIRGERHNVVFLATENDSLYGFDADDPGCKAIWSSEKVSLIPSDEKVAPLDDLEHDSFALGPVAGITGTPVIDVSSQTIYLVAVTESKTAGTIIQRLHAIDITTGRERPNSPVVIEASVKGTGYDNKNGMVAFKAKMQKQRTALLLLNGVVYICWAGYYDTDPYHGWVIGYSASTLKQVSVFNDSIDGGRGGIWLSGASPAADSQGNLYLLSGNGDFNANHGGRNYGDTFMKLSTSGGLSVADWFTPFDEKKLAAEDLDLGSGGAVLLPDQGQGPIPHLVLGSAKIGKLYLVNRDNFGHYNSSSDSQIVQSFVVDKYEVLTTPLFWQNVVYTTADIGPLKAFRFLTATGQFEIKPFTTSNQPSVYPGVVPVISAAGKENAILWVIDPRNPGVLRAYDPMNLATEFWNSSQRASDKGGAGVKFSVPTVANGKVYVGTKTELDVYGLLPE